MRLAFLHIRKNAGTSFRFLVAENYGEAKICWEHDANKLVSAVDNTNVQVFGGHVTRNDFMPCHDESIVFCAITRNPIERIISLYNHHNSKALWAGVVPGFSAHSLHDTIINCEKFREMCNQDQCHTVSGTRTFAETIARINKGNYIIGTLNYVDLLIEKLGKMFGWRTSKITKSNRAYGSFREKISVDGKTLGVINDLVSEDIKFHEFITEQKIFISPLLQMANLHEEHKIFMQGCTLESGDRAQVDLQLTTKKLSCAPADRMAIPVVIDNKSSRILPREGNGCVKFSYHLFNKERELMLMDGIRTYLPGDIHPQERLCASVVVKAPAHCGTYYIKIGLIHDEIAWFDDDNAEHEKELELDVQDNLPDLRYGHVLNSCSPRKVPDFSMVMQMGILNDDGMGIQLKSGWYDVEHGTIPSRWTADDAAMLINSTVQQMRMMSITVTSFNKSRRCRVLLNQEEIFQETITTDLQNMVIPLALQTGENEIHVLSMDGAESPADIAELRSPDQRKLAFNVSGIEIIW